MAESSDHDVGAAGLPIEHVLHVADRDACARFGPMLAQLTQGLCASGVRTTLLTDAAEMVARLARTPVRCIHIPRLTGWRAWGLGSQFSVPHAPPPDLVHLWGTAGLRAVERWAASRGVPVLVHVFGAAQVDHLIRTDVRNAHVLAASAILAGRIPAGICRCQTVRPAVAPPVAPGRGRAVDHMFSVLCVTHAGDHGGLDVLVDAVAQVRRSTNSLHVGLVGGGLDVQAIWRRIRAQDVRDCVSLVDELTLWERVLPEVDACIVPTSQHELSIVPLMAMALGKIVITSRNQLGEWFVEDRTAWQFTPNSTVELAYLLSRAIEQPKRAAELRAAAAEYVRTHHSIRNMIAELLAHYADVAGRTKTTPINPPNGGHP